MRLVELVDELLDSMEADRLRFTLDGQVATVDDYLEVRPAGRAAIERLIAEGRLAIGPWQILMDEFLVSGETIIRNLEIGWHAAETFGEAMPRRLPAGHVRPHRPDAADPAPGRDRPCRRLARRARGDRPPCLRWRAPDGSQVRAEYLVGGYGNGAYLLAIPDRLPKVARYVEAGRAFYGALDPRDVRHRSRCPLPAPGRDRRRGNGGATTVDREARARTFDDSAGPARRGDDRPRRSGRASSGRPPGRTC